ncbi:MAG TPA: hypothetical protein VF121_02725 [Thermoanaerobaculia bacterium]|nr:hypothetical protein [Thermoanaerobaculia bacterium]
MNNSCQRAAVVLAAVLVLPVAAGAQSGGGLRAAVAPVLGDATRELLFVPLAPCRIIDTRKVSHGFLQPGAIRDFLVAGVNGFLAQGGTGGGCGVPDGTAQPKAPAVAINFVAVGPAGPGHLTAWEYGEPVPGASIINYSNVSGLNIANGVVVPIDGTTLHPFDMHVQAAVSGTHLVADVTGYFTRFPIEAFSEPSKDILRGAVQPNPTDLSAANPDPTEQGAGRCERVATCTVTTPVGVNGKVLVKSWANVQLAHVNGTHDRIIVGPRTETPGELSAAPRCHPVVNQVANMDFELPDVAPTTNIDATISHGREFNQLGNTTVNYSLLAKMFDSPSPGDQVESARMVCLFIPD